MAAPPFHGAKPAKKEKQIPDANALIGQVTLRCTILTKERMPGWWARTNGGVKIRVEMGAGLPVNAAMRQRLDQIAQLVFAPT
jgi:hypothetical protein